jgi:lysophospholipase L1-like esterase
MTSNQENLIKDIKTKISSNRKFKILLYGDSSTSTEWVQPNWPAIVEYVLKMELENFEDADGKPSEWNYSWWNINVINSAINGGRTKDYLERIERDVFDYSPDMIIFGSGGNDVGHINEKEHAENVKLLLGKMKEKIRHIYYFTEICGVSKPGLIDYINEVSSLFPMQGVEHVDVYGFTAKIPKDRIYTYEVYKPDEKFLTLDSWKDGKVDIFHPNSLGNAYVAQYLLQEIFDIRFDPELYITELNKGEKYPRY